MMKPEWLKVVGRVTRAMGAFGFTINPADTDNWSDYIRRWSGPGVIEIMFSDHPNHPWVSFEGRDVYTPTMILALAAAIDGNDIEVEVDVYGGLVQETREPAGITVIVRDFDNCRECNDDDCPDYCEDNEYT